MADKELEAKINHLRGIKNKYTDLIKVQNEAITNKQNEIWATEIELEFNEALLGKGTLSRSYQDFSDKQVELKEKLPKLKAELASLKENIKTDAKGIVDNAERFIVSMEEDLN